MSRFALIPWDPTPVPILFPVTLRLIHGRPQGCRPWGRCMWKEMQAGPDVGDWGEEAALWGRDMWGVRPDSWGSVDLSTGTICVL